MFPIQLSFYYLILIIIFNLIQLNPPIKFDLVIQFNSTHTALIQLTISNLTNLFQLNLVQNFQFVLTQFYYLV